MQIKSRFRSNYCSIGGDPLQLLHQMATAPKAILSSAAGAFFLPCRLGGELVKCIEGRLVSR